MFYQSYPLQVYHIESLRQQRQQRQHKKSVSWDNIVSVYNTYSVEDYDRTCYIERDTVSFYNQHITYRNLYDNIVATSTDSSKTEFTEDLSGVTYDCIQFDKTDGDKNYISPVVKFDIIGSLFEYFGIIE
uniref:Uncharacterized protein n=1 Tax=viral metagenome TaxID=1070528 RepID=A0A6C0H214_9ZZZZ